MQNKSLKTNFPKRRNTKLLSSVKIGYFNIMVNGGSGFESQCGLQNSMPV